MSDDDWRIVHNPHAWVTDEVFKHFLEDRGVSMRCERCGRDDMWWIDTGADGYIPRIGAMPTNHEGNAVTSDTYQMPAARMVCFNCGNIRLHALVALDLWRKSQGRETKAVDSPDDQTVLSDEGDR